MSRCLALHRLQILLEVFDTTEGVNKAMLGPPRIPEGIPKCCWGQVFCWRSGVPHPKTHAHFPDTNGSVRIAAEGGTANKPFVSKPCVVSRPWYPRPPQPTSGQNTHFGIPLRTPLKLGGRWKDRPRIRYFLLCAFVFRVRLPPVRVVRRRTLVLLPVVSGCVSCWVTGLSRGRGLPHRMASCDRSRCCRLSGFASWGGEGG